MKDPRHTRALETCLRLVQIAAGTIVLAVSSSVLSDEVSGPTDEDGRLRIEHKQIPTAMYTLDATYYRGNVYRWQYGGGIAAVRDRYVLGTREGLLYQFWWDDANDLRVEALAHRVPLNAEAFAANVSDNVNQLWFRVADVLVDDSTDVLRVYATHHYWRTSDSCVVMRVSVLSATQEELMRSETPGAWRTLYETSPCIPIAKGNRGNPFAGNLVGGRLVLLAANKLLVTVGDHGLDGFFNAPATPQNVDASYGKTILIDTNTGTAKVCSRGHRVPTGWYADRETGDLWLTENGPRGGDELNHLERGANYGWPEVTYGTAYEMDHWPLTKHPDEHTGYREPTFAWVPSIGVSNLIGVSEGTVFPRWRGDLLVSSMRDESIWRVRVRNERVAYAERIPLETRIRDLLQARDGRLVIWTDEGELMSVGRSEAPAQPKSASE